MSLTVNTNMQALRIQDNLNTATEKMNTAMERMASGSKINSAKDDAAGLAVSTTLSKTISGSKVASSNVKIAQDMLSTAEGTLDVILTNLTRIRDLTEQAANGTYSSTDKAAIASEVEARISQITSLASGASFNGTSLFKGATGTAVSIQSGTGASDQTSLSGTIFAAAGALDIGLFTIEAGSGTTTAQLSLSNVDGTDSTPLYTKDSTTALAAYYTYNDTATGTAALHDASVKTLIDQVFAGTASTVQNAAASTTANKYTLSYFLNNVDAAVTNITNRQTAIGAAQNQLEAVADGLTVQQTNLTSALSTIKDADVAEESASYVQSQILQQASASLLVQANSAPQIALTLIKG